MVFHADVINMHLPLEPKNPVMMVRSSSVLF